MASLHIFRDDGFDTINDIFEQQAIDGDTIFVHNAERPPGPPQPGGVLHRRRSGDTGELDIGVNTITVTKDLTILGLDDHGNEVKGLGVGMPIIRGSSTNVVMDQTNNVCGILTIAPGKFVTIRGLHLKHEVLTEHGSATIFNQVDNAQASSLTIENCKIETMATTAISVMCISVASGSKKPHNVRVRGCQVTGETKDSAIEEQNQGNFSSLNLGAGGVEPLEMSGSTFEISACILDSIILGVAAWNVRGDDSSLFLIAGNAIGEGARSPMIGVNNGTYFGTGIGVSFFSPWETLDVSPNGTIAILGNRFKIGRYFAPFVDGARVMVGAAGVLVKTEKDPPLRTIICRNIIDMDLPDFKMVSPSSALYLDGIYYGCETPQPGPASSAEGGGAQSVTGFIHDNEISSDTASPADTQLVTGIHLGPGAHLVRATDNQLNQLKVQVDSNASRNIFVGNNFAKLAQEPDAAILCDGSQNSFCENDFTDSEITGSNSGKAVCVKLCLNSCGNVVILEHKNVPSGPDGPDPEHQWTDESTHIAATDEKNVVVVIPDYGDSPNLISDRWEVLYQAFKEFQFRTRHTWPIPRPGPPVAPKKIA